MDVAGHVLLEATHLYARNTTSSSSSSTSDSRPSYYKIVGIILAVCSGLFIGVSFVVKKIGLLKANAKYNEVAGEGYGYLKNAWWWAGMTTMIVGEICNFVAYAFVDAILVTPFGALSVVITTILSAIFLKERLSFVGKVGCFQCVIGAVVIALNAPDQSGVSDIQEMQHYVISPGFLTYAGIIVVGSIFTALWVGPRWGKKSMFVYITICSVIGGLSVVATQGLGAAIVAQISGTNTHQFEQWFLYVLLVFVVVTLLTEIIYLNKALNLFNAALVTPTYYVMFTSATIITSAILFKGFHGTATEITTVVMGFLFICSGVVLLQLAKSSKDVPDTAIFQGDLDQMRTIAEQEEPESEPRADTIRGGAAIVRAISKKRTMRQLDEVKTIYSEHMEPISEDDPVYFDGLRRRRTVLAPGQSSIRRQKTVHPPLGMSRVPDQDADAHSDAGSTDTDVHPGFHFPKFMARRKSSAKTNASSGLTEMKDLEAGSKSQGQGTSNSTDGGRSDHVFGLPLGLQPLHSNDGASEFEQDTSYKSPSPHINFASNLPPYDGSSSLVPPKPPPHGGSGIDSGGNSGTAKRTFSFQNPVARLFNKHQAVPTHDNDDDDYEERFRYDTDAMSVNSSSVRRPLSRTAFSYTAGSSRHGSYGGRSSTAAVTPSRETEEERLGLVKGDSNSPSGNAAAVAAAARHSGHGSSHGYGIGSGGGSGISEEDEDWLVTSGRSESPEDLLAGDIGRARIGESGSGRDLGRVGVGGVGGWDSDDEAEVEALNYVRPRRPSDGL